MMVLYITSIALYIVSFALNPKKTEKALKIAAKMFLKLMPTFLMLILVMSMVLYVIPPEYITEILDGNNDTTGIIIASLIGSIAVIPGFIVFPLSKILLEEGISYGVLAGFTTSLMMVGVVTFPLERKCFGTKFTIIRNITAYFIALGVSIVIAKIL